MADVLGLKNKGDTKMGEETIRFALTSNATKTNFVHHADERKYSLAAELKEKKKKKKKNADGRFHVQRENWKADEFPGIKFYNDENKWCPLCDGRTIEREGGYVGLLFFSLTYLWGTTKKLLEMAQDGIKVSTQDVRRILRPYFQGKFHAESGVANFDSFECQDGPMCYHCLEKAENALKARIGLN